MAGEWHAVVVGLAALAGLGAGAVTSQVLSSGGYRVSYDADERDLSARPFPRTAWWPLPALALLWGGIAWALGDLAAYTALAPYLLLGWLTVALTWIDIDVHRLPDGLVLPAYPLLAVLLAVPTAVLSVDAPPWGRVAGAVLGAGVLLGVYGLLHLLSPHGMGLGDVKLSGLLGMTLGWLGGGAVVNGLLAGFLIGGLNAMYLLASRRIGLKGHLAMGPSMLAGALVAVVWASG